MKFSKKELLALAKPEQVGHKYVWWYGPENLLAPEKGIIPIEVRKLLSGEVEPPPGNGGVWFLSVEAANKALQQAVEALD